MIEALRRTCLLFVSAYSSMPTKKPRWLNDHRRIVQHLQAGEADKAVLALRRHLEGAAQHLLERMTAARSKS